MSFALAPSPYTHPLRSNIAVINKDGDIEMHEMHDVPKHAVWSSRGDAAVGVGLQVRVFPGFHDNEPPKEPWELEANVEASLERESSSAIAKGKASRPQSRMGDGERRASSLTATRNSGGRTYSPASIMRHPLESPVARTMGMDLRSTPPETLTSEPAVHIDDSSPHHSHSSKVQRADIGRSASRGRRRLPETAPATVIQVDISMIIRSRVLRGYGLFNVSLDQS